jgi:exosortase H (IPTLxxWG-CTERM-specific)
MPMSRKKRHRSRHSKASSYNKGPKPKRSIVKFAVEWVHRHPIFVFLLIFGILMGLFYGITLFTPFWKDHFMPAYLNFTATVSGALLRLLGQDVTVTGNHLSSPAFSVAINRGCSAIEPTALFISAVIAFPAFYLKKIPGIIFGTLSLAILNLIRIVTLFLIGVYFRQVFHLMHIDVWQGLFVFFAVILWVVWILWAMRSQISTQETSSESKPD